MVSFAGGPAILPPEVLHEVQEAVGDWRGSGLSVLEVPFGSSEYATIQQEMEGDLRALLVLPPNYRVLLLQGGAFAQFRLVPLNLLGSSDCAAYVETGYWSARAMAEAGNVCRVAVAARARHAVPPVGTWCIPREAVYCHITGNETADGVQFHEFPVLDEIPVVADLTADLLTGPIDIRRFGLIYASAQKNLGAAGLTIVIVREDLLAGGRPEIPAPLNYARQAGANNRVNTPPIFAVFVAGRMLKWLRRQGGLAQAAARCRRRSEMLYRAIEESDFYTCPVRGADRSRVSICFHLPDPALESTFLAQARQRGLLHLNGHSAIGGLRACLYNAMPEAGVAALVAFMTEFASAVRAQG
jgi:phosphoserine aminotransferase